jgi:hypothetical protein
VVDRERLDWLAQERHAVGGAPALGPGALARRVVLEQRQAGVQIQG